MPAIVSDHLRRAGTSSPAFYQNVENIVALADYAQHLHWVQIGLVNIIKEGGKFPVFPIVNWSLENDGGN